MPAPFVLAADGPDVSRVFVLPLPVDRQRYVRGIEFRANNPRIHHANIRIDATPASRELDEQDAVPGYDGIIVRSAVYPDGHFLGWTPGQAAPLLPPGLAWTLAPRSDFVLQLHLVPSGNPELIQPSIGVYFTDDPPSAHAGDDAAVESAHRHPRRRCEYIASDSFVLPVDVEVLAVQPHAHYLAREVMGIGDAAGWQKPNAHLDCRLGPAVAARLSVSDAGATAEGHHRQHAVPIRQLRGEPPQSRRTAGARAVGTAVARRDGRLVAAGRDEERRPSGSCSTRSSAQSGWRPMPSASSR